MSAKSGRSAASSLPVSVVANPLLTSTSSRTLAPLTGATAGAVSTPASLDRPASVTGPAAARHSRAWASGAGFPLGAALRPGGQCVPAAPANASAVGFGSRLMSATPRAPLQALAAIETLVLSRVGLSLGGGGSSGKELGKDGGTTTVNPLVMHRAGLSDGNLLLTVRGGQHVAATGRAHGSRGHRRRAQTGGAGGLKGGAESTSASILQSNKQVTGETAVATATATLQPAVAPASEGETMPPRPVIPSLRLATITSYSLSDSHSEGSGSHSAATSRSGATTAASTAVATPFPGLALDANTTSTTAPVPGLDATVYVELGPPPQTVSTLASTTVTDALLQPSLLAKLNAREAARSASLSQPLPHGPPLLAPPTHGEAGLALQLDFMTANTFTLAPSPVAAIKEATEPSSSSRAAAARFNVLCEVVATEHAFVADLQALVKLFVRPLEEDAAAAAAVAYAASRGSSGSSGSGGGADAAAAPELILAPSLIPVIFSNLAELLDAHAWLLRAWWEGLRTVAHTATGTSLSPGAEGDLGDTASRYDVLLQAFTAAAPALRRLHATFSSGFETAAATARSEESKSGLFAGFVAFNRLKPEARGKDLHSLLIAPVQRLCRYPLLFKTLAAKAGCESGAASVGHPAAGTLQALVAVAERLAADVNADVALAQAARRLSSGGDGSALSALPPA